MSTETPQKTCETCHYVYKINTILRCALKGVFTHTFDNVPCKAYEARSE